MKGEKKNASQILKTVTALVVLLGTTFFSACESDDPKPVVDQELITTLKITFKKAEVAEDPVTFVWKDIDGSGSGAPVIDPIALDAHSEYTYTLTLLNESVNPVEDVTLEISEADEDHQFFFAATVDGIITTYEDTDGNGKPIGLSNTIMTDHEGTGTFTVTLIHQPNKGAVGVEDGNPSNAGGDTDLETEFPLTVVE